MASPRRCLSAALLLLQAQGQAVLQTTCEQVATFPYSCWPRGVDVDECGGIFVSAGCYLWAFDRRNFSEPRLQSSTRRRGYGKVIARRDDLLVSLRGRNKVVSMDKEMTDGDTDVNVTVLIDFVDDPIGIALTPDGHLLVAESDDDIVGKWTLQVNSSRVAVVAGNGETSGNRSIGNPYGLAVSSTGRVCSTDTSNQQLFCYPSDDSDAPTDELQLVKTGLPSDPYHVSFDADDNLWLGDYSAPGRLWVFLANGTEVLLEFGSSTGAYSPIAMVVDVVDDSRFLLLGHEEEADNALFLCNNPVSSGRTTPECTSTTSTASSSTTFTLSTSTSSTISSTSITLSSTSSSTLSSTTSATHTETSPPSIATTGTTRSTTDTATSTASTTTGTTSPTAAMTSSPALQGPSTLPSSPTSAAADGGSMAALGGATSSGQTPGVPGTSTAAPAAPAETSAAPAETSAAGTAPSTRAAATSASLGLQPSAAPTETSSAPTKTPAPGDVPSTTPTATTTSSALPHTTAPSETSAAPGSSAPAVTAPIGKTASTPLPATIMVEMESSSKGLAPPQILLILVAASAAL